MSLQGPIVVVAEKRSSQLLEAISTAGAFPVIETSCDDAAAAIAAADPTAIILADSRAATDTALAECLSRDITRKIPMVPVVACAGPDDTLSYRDALMIGREATPAAVTARVASVLRVRSLQASVLRRAEAAQAAGKAVPQTSNTDPIEDATIILAGRGRTYPELSVGIGEQTGLIGVLSVEAAARFLKTRDADGLVIGDGFHPQSVEAILTVVAEDSRFRDLPIGVIGHQLSIDERELPHLVFADNPSSLITKILPLVRLHAFERRLRRTLENFEQDGVVDPATGLLYHEAFIAELERVMRDADQRSAGLSVARFIFDPSFDSRAINDAARMIGKLKRTVDFACRDDDGSILLAFAETDLRRAQAVTRRLSNVLKHTMLLPENSHAAVTPRVTLTRRKPADTVASLLSRVTIPAVAAE
jgi:hypothetical protein